MSLDVARVLLKGADALRHTDISDAALDKLATVRGRVWCVVCGVWCVVCGVWCVVCDVWCVVCGVWCVVCGVWCVVCDVWCVMCVCVYVCVCVFFV